MKSPSVQKFSFSSQKTIKLSDLNSQEAATLLASLNILKLDGMCLSLVENQTDLDDLVSVKIPNIKFRALQNHLERFKMDGVPLELIQPSSSSEAMVSPSLSEAVKIESNIVKTTEETNKESTSALLPGFTLVNSWKPTTEYELAAHPSVKKGDNVELGLRSGVKLLFF